MSKEMQNNKEKQSSKEGITPAMLENATHGENKHDSIFNRWTNFGLNLVVSATFTYWVKHSGTKRWWLGNKTPGDLHESARRFMKNTITSKLPIGETAQQKTAEIMADALTLTTAGSAVMIPSVYFGEKYKHDLIVHWDKKHYGEDAVAQDAWLQARHEAVAHEHKPSFLGTVLGRVGTMAAVQTAALTIGNTDNAITWLGNKWNAGPLKKFPGLDNIAGGFGESVGGALAKMAPSTSDRVNGWLRSKHFTHAKSTNASIKAQPYNTGFDDFFKWTAMDVLYTAITSVTIHPIIKMAKEYLPGMMYKPERPENRVEQLQTQGRVQQPRTAEVYA